MLNKDDIRHTERQTLERFFGTTFSDIPSVPDWITDKLLHYWNEHIFHLHYIPNISLENISTVPLWRDKPSAVFYQKMREGKLKSEAAMLPGKWLLIDGREKPAKKVPWIRVNDVRILQKLGFNPKTYLQKWKVQLHHREYLSDVLQKKGFGSRFCFTIREIDDLKPFISHFLKIDPHTNFRLPFFAEYNYLGNAIYTQWRTTETWEWFEDIYDGDQHLAGGSKSVGCIGWEPPEFWSTILTFRPVIELTER